MSAAPLAFPSNDPDAYPTPIYVPGMDLRDYFAARIAAVLIESAVLRNQSITPTLYATVGKQAYEQADQLLVARSL